MVNKSSTSIRLEKMPDGIYLYLNSGVDLTVKGSKIINSSALGQALVPESIFESADGNPILFNKDYFGVKGDLNMNGVGPLNRVMAGETKIRLWPK